MYYKCYLQASTVLLFVLFEEIAPAKATTKFIINIVISMDCYFDSFRSNLPVWGNSYFLPL